MGKAALDGGQVFRQPCTCYSNRLRVAYGLEGADLRRNVKGTLGVAVVAIFEPEGCSAAAQKVRRRDYTRGAGSGVEVGVEV